MKDEQTAGYMKAIRNSVSSDIRKDLISTRKELEECKIQLRVADNGLLKASDPKSNWQGIQKECKLWQEKAESLEQELERCKKSLLCEEVEHNATMEELEELRGKVRRYFKAKDVCINAYYTNEENYTKERLLRYSADQATAEHNLRAAVEKP